MYKNSLLKNFKKSDLHLEDFPYISIENALDKTFYNELSINFPKYEAFTDDVIVKENTRYDIPSEKYLGSSSAWKEFLDYHSSIDFFESVISIFLDEIKKTDNQNLINLLSKQDLRSGSSKTDFKENKIDLWHDIGININTKVSDNKPSVRTPHLDNPTDIWWSILQNPNDNCKGGDLEYKFKNKKRYNGNAVPSRFVKKFTSGL